MLMSSLQERVRERLAELNMTPRAASLRAGLSSDFMRSLFGRPDRTPPSPSVDNIARLAAALDCSAAWLAYGIGDIASPDIGLVPVLGQVAAGSWREVDDGVDEPRTNRLLAADPRFPAAAQYGLTAVGESMNLLFRDQDDLLCLDYRKLASPRAPAHDDVVIVEQLRNGGTMREVSAKQLAFTPDGPVLFARSDHPKWRDFTLRPSGPADNDNLHVEIKAIVLRSERQWWHG